MAFDYSGLIATADQLISDFGRDVTIRRKSTTPTDPTKPWRDVEPFPAGDSLTVKAVIVPQDAEQQPGSRVRRDTATAHIAAAADGGNELETFDEILEADDKVWKIIDVQVIDPGPSRVLYILTLEA